MGRRKGRKKGMKKKNLWFCIFERGFSFAGVVPVPAAGGVGDPRSLRPEGRRKRRKEGQRRRRRTLGRRRRRKEGQ